MLKLNPGQSLAVGDETEQKVEDEAEAEPGVGAGAEAEHRDEAKRMRQKKKLRQRLRLSQKLGLRLRLAMRLRQRLKRSWPSGFWMLQAIIVVAGVIFRRCLKLDAAKHWGGKRCREKGNSSNLGSGSGR